ncbi:MAG TPA: amidohydrolase family protein [Candidatus Eisenbacteria bacterium]|nr:amidohydrolase family protein [Candidatus Eisenbacteria bacterium]
MRLCLAAVALLALARAPLADVTAYKAARIITGAGTQIADGVILVENGKITAVGAGLKIPDGAKVVDLGSATVIPGLVDANLILWLDGPENEEAREITPDFRVVDGLNPKARDLQRAVQTGVTTAFVAPGNRNVIGGLAAVLKTSGPALKDMIVRDEAALKATVGSGPSSGNYPPRGMPPMDFYARRPTTRMGVTWEFRRAFIDAGTYASERPAKPDPARDVLARALDRKLPVRIAASRAFDIESALRLADEFKLAVTLEEAEEAYRYVDALAKRKTPVALRPTFQSGRIWASDGSELRYGTFAALANAGVPTALLTGGSGEDESLLAMAAFAVRYGATREQALRAITLTPAEMLGVADRVGTLEKGKDADFAVLTGDPLDLTSRVERVVVNGRTAYERKPQ